MLSFLFVVLRVIIGNSSTAAQNNRQRVGARSEAGRTRGPIGRLEPTIEDVLQASKENQQLLRRELDEKKAALRGRQAAAAELILRFPLTN